MDNKAQSIGFSWIIALILIFTMGLMFVIFNQVYNDYILSQANYLIANVSLLNATGQAEAQAQITKYNYFWSSIPIIIFVGTILWLILSAGRKQPGEQ